jgi:hypothetical protein
MLLIKVKFEVIMYLIYVMGPPMKLGMTLQEHNVIESKPYNKVDDVRLHNPWLKLQRFVTPPILDIRFQGGRLIICCYLLET